MAVWEFTLNELQANRKVAFLAVLQSEGSSPGRQGFKMALSASGEMAGSIGGGIMEHKLVELARNLLAHNQTNPVLKRQVHSKTVAINQSGMICSGEQTVAIYFLDPTAIPDLEKLVTAIKTKTPGSLILTENALSFQAEESQATQFTFSQENDSVWQFTEKIPVRDAVYIVGGGHVSLALSNVLKFLHFDIHLFDDRPDLNTFEENHLATSKTLIPYHEVAGFIPEGNQNYVVIMTIGYRTDKLVLQKLLNRKFAYLGLLGSKAKIAQLFSELKTEGFSETALKNVHAPIGSPIKSKTPEEIAISIAAEIIKVKNG